MIRTQIIRIKQKLNRISYDRCADFQDDYELYAINFLSGGELESFYYAERSSRAPITEIASTVERVVTDFQEYTNIFERMKDDLAKDREYREAVLSNRSRDCFLLLMNPYAHRLIVNALQARLDIEGVSNKAYQIVRNTLLDAQKNIKYP